MFKVIALVLSFVIGWGIGGLGLSVWVTALLALTVGFLVGLLGVALDEMLDT